MGAPWFGLWVAMAVAQAGTTATAQQPLGLDGPKQPVPQYGKAEFSIRVGRDYQHPFGPAEVDLRLDITSPSGARVSVPAFFCQGYERRRIARDGREADWFYPARSPAWLARYAPSEVGTYAAVARLRDDRGDVSSEPARFECTRSDNRGFVRASATDPRFLEFSNGQPFFAIGQDLALIGEDQYADLYRAEAIFAKLSGNGANFLRIWTCCDDWAMAIEAPKSAWDRSWERNAPIVQKPDDAGQPTERKCVQLAGEAGASLTLQPTHPVALKPATKYVMAGSIRTDAGASVSVEIGARTYALGGADPGWGDFRVEFETEENQFWLGRPVFRLDKAGKAWLDALQLAAAGGGPNLLWEGDPNRPPRGYYNPVDCFMLDELVQAAERNGIYLQLCLLTRDLYMPHLSDEASPDYDQAIRDARNLLRYAVARWGYSTSVAAWEYFNEMDPGKPTARFYREVGEYLTEADPYHHLRTTSAWASAPNDWRHPEIDIAQEHFYLRPSDRQRVADEVAAVVERARLIRQQAAAKPALMGEFGLATEEWRLSDRMTRDADLVHFHNALWASALSGLSGTAMFWWWEQLDQMNAYHHYAPLARFVADIPFTTAGPQDARAESSDARVRVVGLQGRDCAYCWLLNEAATWTRVEAAGPTVADIEGAVVTVRGLSPGAYRVDWWDTRSGTVISSREVVVAGDSIPLGVPSFRCDIACKLVRRQ